MPGFIAEETARGIALRKALRAQGCVICAGHEGGMTSMGRVKHLWRGKVSMRDGL